MRFYNQPHRFYGGVDLHARTMYLCILDQAGQVVFDKNFPAQYRGLLRRDLWHFRREAARPPS